MRRIEVVYISLVITFAAAFCAMSLADAFNVGPAADQVTSSTKRSTRRLRKFDVAEVKTLIERGQLSGREADNYEVIDEDALAPATDTPRPAKPDAGTDR